MIDAHIHIGRTNGASIGRPAEQAIRAAFEAYAALGISAVRDGGDAHAEYAAIARAVAAEMGMLYKTPVFALVKRGGYGAFIGREVEKEDFSAAFAELKRFGADFVKIVQSGIVSFDVYGEVSPGGFSPDELRFLIGAAHDMGLKTMVHCNGERPVDMAVSSGADSIEHGYFIGRPQLEAMAETGAVWTPTFAPLANYLKSGRASGPQTEVITQTLQSHGENLRAALELGVRIAVGSDAGAAFVRHGHGVLEELECFARAGVSPETARALAETNGALALA